MAGERRKREKRGGDGQDGALVFLAVQSDGKSLQLKESPQYLILGNGETEPGPQHGREREEIFAH